MANPLERLDPTKLNKVALDDQPRQIPQPTPGPMEVVSEPSEFYGLPKDLATILEKSKPQGNLVDRLIGHNLPKYAYQLGAGAVESSTLGLAEMPYAPRTTGEELVRGIGHIYGSTFVPVGPAVAAGVKTGKLSGTAAGALANMAATEIETRGQADLGRLALSGVFGAIFGRFYGKSLEGRARNVVGGYINKARDMDVPPFVGPSQTGRRFSDLADRTSPPPGRAPADRPLLTYQPSPPRTDFLASAAEHETSADRTLRAAKQTLTGGGKFEELPPMEGARPVRRDILGEEPPVIQRTRDKTGIAVYGKGLLKEAGVAGKAGSTQRLVGEQTQRILRKMKLAPDKDVRETAKAIETFNKHSDDIPENFNVAKLAADVREGRDTGLGNAYTINPWDDPYTIGPVPRSKLHPGTGMAPGLRPPKDVFADVYANTGGRINAFEDFWNAATAREKAHSQIGSLSVEYKPIHRVLASKNAQEGILAMWKTSDPNQKALIAHTYGLTKEQVDAGNKARQIFEKLWNRVFPDHPAEQYLTDTLPRLSKGTAAEIEMMKGHDLSGVIHELDQWAANHEMSFREKNLTQFMAHHFRTLSLREHFDDHYKALSKIVGDRTYPQEYRDYLASWLRGARGNQTFFTKNANKVVKNLLNRLGAEATDVDVRDLLDNYTTLTHAGLVGFRAAPLFHNIFNGVQTGSRIGIPWMVKGMRAAKTAAGWERARLAGMIDEAAHEVEALREMAAPGRVTRGIRKVADVGLKPYGKIDDFNRSWMFNGMYERFMDAAKRGGTDRGKVLSMSGLYNFPLAIRDHVMKEWATGNLEKAATLAGTHAAQGTQWVYRTEFRPTAITGDLSRTLGQFGVWPLNYMEYVRQMMRTTFSDKTIPPAERWKWISQFTLTNASIVGAVAAMGASVGLGEEAAKNTMKWTFAGPLSYAGGPALDTMMAIPQLFQDFQSMAIEGKDLSQSQAWRTVKGNVIGAIPGSGLARDIARAKGPLELQLTQQVPVVGPAVGAFESEKVVPAQSVEEELFRIGIGLGVRR